MHSYAFLIFDAVLGISMTAFGIVMDCDPSLSRMQRYVAWAIVAAGLGLIIQAGFIAGGLR